MFHVCVCFLLVYFLLYAPLCFSACFLLYVPLYFPAYFLLYFPLYFPIYFLLYVPLYFPVCFPVYVLLYVPLYVPLHFPEFFLYMSLYMSMHMSLYMSFYSICPSIFPCILPSKLPAIFPCMFPSIVPYIYIYTRFFGRASRGLESFFLKHYLGNHCQHHRYIGLISGLCRSSFDTLKVPSRGAQCSKSGPGSTTIRPIQVIFDSWCILRRGLGAQDGSRVARCSLEHFKVCQRGVPEAPRTTQDQL